jgi:hypothetical protein
MLEGVMASPRGRVVQLGEPLLKNQMVGSDHILAQTIEKKMQWRARQDSNLLHSA